MSACKPASTCFFDKLEAAIKQNLRDAALAVQVPGSVEPAGDVQVHASVVVAFVAGRPQRFARSGFRRPPSEHLDGSLACLLG